jgi:hypothetical protein
MAKKFKYQPVFKEVVENLKEEKIVLILSSGKNYGSFYAVNGAFEEKHFIFRMDDRELEFDYITHNPYSYLKLKFAVEEIINPQDITPDFLRDFSRLLGRVLKM